MQIWLAHQVKRQKISQVVVRDLIDDAAGELRGHDCFFACLLIYGAIIAREIACVRELQIDDLEALILHAMPAVPPRKRPSSYIGGRWLSPVGRRAPWLDAREVHRGAGSAGEGAPESPA